MNYDAERDVYTCKYGKELRVTDTKSSKSASGYRSTATVYRCEDCKGCPYKEKCIKGNKCKTPMEERFRFLYVSKKEMRRKS